MGNSSGKESRGPSASHRSTRPGESSGDAVTGPGPQLAASRTGRGTRNDSSFLGIGSSSNGDRQSGRDGDAQEPRRETKQEREARKLEKERLVREKERVRSMKEEHVDGGYLVTQGVYTGTEDFSKPVVRQLMIERRIAPFWRGLEDFKDTWTEHQLVAAARGLAIPAPDEIPEEEEPDLTGSSHPNLNNLTVPISSRSASYNSDDYDKMSSSHPARPIPSHGSSLFRPRSKTLASLTTSSKNTSQEPVMPQELNMPRDPLVNGQKMEAFLYKDATECPICFIYYPPYLNKTRCCDQPICSECFVQIKRPEPHAPEHADPNAPAPQVPTPEQAESLVCEPSCCPYCQQDEFGVTYEPPPFKRGLTYAMPGRGNLSPAMNSSTSLDSMGSPIGSPTPGMQFGATSRRRTTSVSANASTVITTDRIRPDWAIKLANARNHAARRSAAATALHTAAYLMNGTAPDSRGIRLRFGRHRDTIGDSSGSVTPADREIRMQQLHYALAEVRRTEIPSGSRTDRRSRIDDLEDMMMMEAIRLSLVAEEEAKKKEEKAAAKEAKKKAKEDKKLEKKDRRSLYGGSNSGSSSALNLSMPSLGRHRGNSGSSAYLREATLNRSNNAADKGKSTDREVTSSSPIAIRSSPNSKGKSTGDSSASHEQHASGTSSPSSSFIESTHGSLRDNHTTHHGSSSSLDTTSGHVTPGTLAITSPHEIDSGNATPNPTEPMFNFRSLSARIEREEAEQEASSHGHEESKEDKSSTSEHLEFSNEKVSHEDAEGERSESARRSTGTLKQSDYDNGVETGDGVSTLQVPRMMVTPVTPGVGQHEDKQLGNESGMGFTGTGVRS